MTPLFIRNLIIYTIANVTGMSPCKIAPLKEIKLDARDWEQIFSRLEATLDMEILILAPNTRTLSINNLTQDIHNNSPSTVAT